MPNEMSAGECAERLQQLGNDAYGENKLANICLNDADILRTAASILRKVAAGKLGEVVHARWIVKPLPMPNDPPSVEPWNVRYHCSNCNFTTGPTAANYCPSCGALMGGKDDNSHADS